jgi:uncharacterized membrane protein
MKQFLKTTIVGGVIFLLPVALVLFILGHALALAAKVIEPVSTHLHIERFGTLTGISIVTTLSVVFLVLVSFMAGLAARTAPGARMSGWLENSLLGRMPQYRMVKSMAEGMASAERASSTMKPALIRVDGGWQLCYVLETLDNGWIVVLVPQAPTTMSGNVMYVPPDSVRVLDITMTQATNLVRSIGIGSRQILRGAEMAPAG